ncbi:MAG TPA: hypothetical protein VJR29_11400 [bacterium]|nr:hypothetical protein [bacterium]
MQNKLSSFIFAFLFAVLFSLPANTYADPWKDESGKGWKGDGEKGVVAAPVPVPVLGAPRHIQIPPGHYPPPGECRLWYPDRPAGQQPPPVPCGQLGAVGGSFILYEGKAWDADYDWREYARLKRGKVPRLIINLTI